MYANYRWPVAVLCLVLREWSSALTMNLLRKYAWASPFKHLNVIKAYLTSSCRATGPATGNQWSCVNMRMM